MRDLTPDESDLLTRRRERFAAFIDECVPVLADFMESLELPEPAFVAVEAERFLPPLEAWLTVQNVGEEDWNWLVTRVGYFAGEYLVQRHSGCWFVNDIPDSRYFAQYVVGHFARAENPSAMLDPFVLAADFVSQPPGRSLSKVLVGVERELKVSV